MKNNLLTTERVKKFYKTFTQIYLPVKKYEGGYPEIEIFKNGDLWDAVKILKRPSLKDLQTIVDKILNEQGDVEQMYLRMWDDEYNGYYTSDGLKDYRLLIYQN